jgi:hypothetical protein
MQTVKQIAKEIGVCETTIKNRIIQYGIKPKKQWHTFLLNEKEVALVKIPFTSNYNVITPSKKLIKQCILENPYLSDEEIAMMLAIDVKHVDRSDLVLESKIN